MAQGTVKWFSKEKGYGFIVPDDGSEDLFVHYTGIAGEGFKTLEEGTRVTYEASPGRKGMQAANVAAVLADRQHTKGSRPVERGSRPVERSSRPIKVPIRGTSTSIPGEGTPDFKPGDSVVLTESHYLTGREARVLTASPSELMVRI